MNYVQYVTVRIIQEKEIDYDLAQFYALLLLTKGTDTTLEDVHHAWALWQDYINPSHRSLIPFEDLSLEVQELDRPYMEVIHKVTQDMQISR